MKKRGKGKTQKQKPARINKNNAAEVTLEVIRGIGKNAPLKKVFAKLVKRFTQEEIILALNRLDHEGKISISNNGKIQLLHVLPDERQTANRKTHYVFGTVDLTRNGDAYVTIDKVSKDIFVPQKLARNALQGDEVKVLITRHGRRPEGEIVEIIKRSQDTFTGRVDVLQKFAFFIADDRKLSTDVFIPLDALKGAKHDDRVIVRVTEWSEGNKKPVGEVLEILTTEYSTDLDMKKILMENGFSIDFPKSVYNELAKHTDVIPSSEIRNRLDYRNILTFTIDPIDAKDFDDAISFRKLENGNYEVGVHIADVSYYVREGSELDKEAERRATSVYLPDRVCPMLPERLSNELCSLRPNEDKLTFSTIFEIDASFNIIHFTIAKTVIHSNRRFSYEEVQEIIETGQGDYAEELKTLLEISKKLREKRFKKGAIAFEKAEVRFKLDNKGKPLGIVLKIRKDAHLMVEDYMLLANETVAKYGAAIKLDKKQIPFVYRIHDKPDPAKLEQFSAIASRFGYNLRVEKPEDAAPMFNTLLKKIEGKPEQNVLETMAIRSMAKAEYTTYNIGHYGLAMEHYTHFTSPIRRYPDILVHRLVYEHLSKGNKFIDRDELESRCKNSSVMERKAMDAEREATKYKQIEFMQDKVGQTFDGIISGVLPRGVFVELIENKCEGMISTDSLGNEDFAFDERMLRLTGTRSGKHYQLGDPIKVRVLTADIILRRMDLEPA